MSKQPSPADAKKDKALTGGQVTLDFTVRFEDLTFGRVLGQGGYGKVFEGEWKFNPVAIKQYTAQDFSESTRQEIRKEAMIMATVSTQSDYLVRLRGMILEKPHYSLVMEYMPGGDLFHLLKSSQELTWTMRYRISLDMTIGLHHLHERGGLHRDLKSLNVLLDLYFRAKLADFGLSTLKTSSASTTAGGFKGTALWSAPELFKRGAKATTYSDIYSLGMVLWELVSRQIPFADAATPAIAMDWVKTGEQENIPEGTPEEFKTLILDCWDKEPGQRPAAAAVAKRLDTLWQAERKLAPTSPASSSSSASGSVSTSGSSESVMIPTLADSSALPEEAMPVPRKSPAPGAGLNTQVIQAQWQNSLENMAKLQAELDQKPSGTPEPFSSPKPAVLGGAEDGEMKKLLAEVMKLKLEKSEDERRRVELEKMAEEHGRLKAEIEREREIKRQKAELKKSPSAPKPENPASSPPVRQPDIKKPVTSEPVSPPSSVLSQSRFTIAPAPKPLIKPVDEKALSQLLQFVAEGEQDKAEALIQKDKNLLWHAGPVKDLSGREFKQITAFQYALWAMDWHMWTMIQKHLPKEAQAEQLQALETKGTAHGKHFNLQELTDALQVYVDNAAKWNYDQRAETQWCKVGVAQNKLPAQVVNEYCRGDRPFEPCPQEWESKLSRTREIDVWDSTQSKYVKGSWFIAPSSKDGLGLNFAFCRYSYGGPPRACVLAGPLHRSLLWRALADLKALQSLWKTRTQQLELLKSQLLSVVSQSQVFGSSR